jgi:hypothetical protein
VERCVGNADKVPLETDIFVDKSSRCRFAYYLWQTEHSRKKAQGLLLPGQMTKRWLLISSTPLTVATLSGSQYCL